MRDPARIDRILGLIKEIWKAHPDLRLGQLLVSIVSASPLYYLFYIEDEALEKCLLGGYGVWEVR